MSYSFNKDYSSLSGINVPLDIYDKNFGLIVSNTLTPISGGKLYSGKIGGIYAIPNFEQANSIVSDTDFFIDFGDGTIVENELSAFHEYKIAGNYPITLVVTASSGSFFRSVDSYMLNINDPIPDKIFISQDSKTQEESESTVKFYITRYNTLETSRALSADNYKINLSVNGNKSPLELESTYLDNTNFQYQNKSFFLTSPDEDFKVIDSVETTSDVIYGRLDPLYTIVDSVTGQNLVLSTSPISGSTIVGTSGIGSFYYFEPTV